MRVQLGRTKPVRGGYALSTQQLGRLAPQRVASVCAIPQSQGEAVAQAVAALRSSLRPSSKQQKKGNKLWAGVKQLGVELAVADQSAPATLELTQELLAAVPREAGLPVVVFGNQETADIARQRDVPFEVHSIEECTLQDEFQGPLLLVATSADQAAKCEAIVQKDWSGRALVVVNAEWLRTDTPAAAAGLAERLDMAYVFMPVMFGGLLGAGREGVLVRNVNEDVNWRFYLMHDPPECIGQMTQRPSSADMETMLYNAGAAKSPLSAVAGMFRKLTKG